ncbi:MAG: hypothetical protein HeimAB125_23530 [Candidatus Heimdallarchaeota archaeon AB_125]|nr:MAG: hypothetical protein HeimAB125_23530 [Candidatus Heimdallarchaeota archaeon AB_125]
MSKVTSNINSSTDITSRFCFNCGQKLKADASFCTEFGSIIEATQTGPTTVPQQYYPPQVKRKPSYAYVFFIAFSAIGVIIAAVIFFISGAWLYQASLWIIGISLGVGSLFSGLLTPVKEIGMMIFIVFISYAFIIGALFAATTIFSFTMEQYIILLKVSLVPVAISFVAGLIVRILVEVTLKKE